MAASTDSGLIECRKRAEYRERYFAENLLCESQGGHLHREIGGIAAVIDNESVNDLYSDRLSGVEKAIAGNPLLEGAAGKLRVLAAALRDPAVWRVVERIAL